MDAKTRQVIAKAARESRSTIKAALASGMSLEQAVRFERVFRDARKDHRLIAADEQRYIREG